MADEAGPVAVREGGRLAVGACGLVAGIAAGAALLLGGYPVPAEVLAPTLVLNLAVGWSFIGVGLMAWSRRPDHHTGLLMVFFGFAWLLRLAGAVAQPAWFVFGFVTSSLALAVLVHLLVVFATGRIETRLQRGLVVIGYLLTVPAVGRRRWAGRALRRVLELPAQPRRDLRVERLGRRPAPDVAGLAGGGDPARCHGVLITLFAVVLVRWWRAERANAAPWARPSGRRRRSWRLFIAPALLVSRRLPRARGGARPALVVAGRAGGPGRWRCSSACCAAASTLVKGSAA